MLRAAICAAAVRFAKHLGYRSAGTVEFLVDVEHETFYFLEMNARIQVEHAITEQVTGIDLVEEQIAIADGQGLRISQDQIRLNGCAIECRINAEDPVRDFAPSPGTVTEAVWPEGEGIRVDTHIVSGAHVPPYYDSLLAKLIAHGTDRATALARLAKALGEIRIAGVATNIAFHQAVLGDSEFVRGGVDTGYAARFLRRASAHAEV
jgi:acetyl-CoA carboxylase biotin carboxylase subunit